MKHRVYIHPFKKKRKRERDYYAQYLSFNDKNIQIDLE